MSTAGSDTARNKLGIRLGIIGGGQLARMLCLAAAPLGVDTVVLDPNVACPAAVVASAVVAGSLTDETSIRELAQQCDVLTCEIEHINAEALIKLEEEGYAVHPSGRTLAIIQDKLVQKQHLQHLGIPCADNVEINSEEDIAQAIMNLGLPLVLKSRRLAYDGRGNYVIKEDAEISIAYKQLSKNGRLYAERWVPFVRELSVIVAKSEKGMQCYPTVETVQKESICHMAAMPANSTESTMEAAKDVANRVVRSLPGRGVFAVEMFELPDGGVLVNEIAPRVHNSGHLTIEASITSQFEQHVRCALGWPVGDTSMKVPAATMLNILGDDGDIQKCYSREMSALVIPGASIHWYGKSECRRGRKMGHVTFVGEKDAVARAIGGFAGTLPGSATDISAQPKPLVAVIMGSDSDLPVMSAAAQILEDAQVPFVVDIVSAHRTPHKMISFAMEAESQGIQVIIAGAGGAAHLPGMVAATTILPVIGVPVPLGHLQGVDALHSIVQMPKGIPVATVAIGNAANAALLALRILARGNPKYADYLHKYQAKMSAEVHSKSDALASSSWRAYLDTMPSAKK